ncbi:MAG: gliding motility-associated C-terminal domain-containing protein [Bacteroidetes bacterium]|nr:gliding motility-associated C-terminal domain-containing protein [Bacteroidota bacterium]
MKNFGKSFFFISLSFYFGSLLSQTANISGIINNYTDVTLVGSQSVNVSNVSGFTVGDKVLLIQMKGASIDTTDTSNFRTIISYNDAGNYEMLMISAITSTAILFSNPILRSYNLTGLLQLVKVPVYNNVNVTGNLTCLPWNGLTGGILIFEAAGNISLNANIDVTGKGFLGGAISSGQFLSCAGNTTGFKLSNMSLFSGNKGEGIAILKPSFAKGLGAIANGGGAGNDVNGGGAGGGNYGLGGHGGNTKCSTSPSVIVGGNEGKNCAYSNSSNKIFLGGGGGSGHENDGVSTAGVSGGGIIIIRCGGSISGNGNFINANGNNNTLLAGNDGQGGGGAGGTVLIEACSTSSLNISVTGGNGGNDNFSGPDCHGKGGGGGGGTIWTSSSLSYTSFLNGGNSGIFTNSNSQCFNTSNGATDGQAGGILTNLIIPGTTALSAIGGFSITATSTNNLCSNSSSATASVFVSGAGPYTYLWSPGNYTTASISNLSAGLYSVTVSSGICSTQTQTILIIDPSPLMADIEMNMSDCWNNNGSFVVKSVIGGVGPYQLNFNNTNHTNDTIFSQLSPGNYTISIKDSNNCETVYALTMLSNNIDGTFYIPNTFTPNNDKLNDVWYIKGTCLDKLNCLIYNRWGEKIRELRDINEGWDGTYKGASVPDGVYVYLIEVTTKEGTINKAGHITVFR